MLDILEKTRVVKLAVLLAVTVGVTVIGTLLGGATSATATENSSLGTPPTGLAQSWCAHMHVDKHVLQVGEPITGTVEPTGLCVPATWMWAFDAARPTKTCAPGTLTTCTFTATEATGKPGDRYVEGCISGSSTFGEWVSCDYYAVLPKCHSHPTFKLTYKREHGTLVVRYRGTGWDTADCGAVTVSGAENGTAIATYDTPNFHGQVDFHGHFVCGLDLFAQQEPNTVRKASIRLGKPAYVVTFLRPTPIVKDNNTIEPGAVLCENDLPKTRDMSSRLTQFAASIGAELFEAERYIDRGTHNNAKGETLLVDAAGKVSVQGVSLEAAPSSLLSTEAQDATTGTLWYPLPPTLEAGQMLTGFSHSSGELVAAGSLILNRAEIYVPGNLVVNGKIEGSGAIFANGSITADGVHLTYASADPGGEAAYGLAAGGRLNLP